MYEVSLISQNGAEQFALGLDEDIRHLSLLADGRAILSYGAEDQGEVYSIGARRGGGWRIVGEDQPGLLPFWPCWPHRGHDYPQHEAFYWITSPSLRAVDVANATVFAVARFLVGLGVGFESSTGYEAVVADIGSDDPKVIDEYDTYMKANGWDGGKAVKTIMEAPILHG